MRLRMENENQEKKKKRAYLSQRDIPKYPLLEALKVAQAIADNYGKQPTKPLLVAKALNISFQSSQFRDLCGASIAYGFTSGGYNSKEIEITDLGRRVVSPTSENDDIKAKIEGFLKPRIIKEFLEKYDGSPIPQERIALNVLEEMGVPAKETIRIYNSILSDANSLSLLIELKSKNYVDLKNKDDYIVSSPTADATKSKNDKLHYEDSMVDDSKRMEAEILPRKSDLSLMKNFKVFIAHGKNEVILSQVKELLRFGNFEPIVAIEQESTAKPIPIKVLKEMQDCYAAIIHVGMEKKATDESGDEFSVLNPNVLIEIGAAMAIYGSRFILLVEKGVKLPSNLQGLYEVRYEGDRLDYDSTMKLLKAFNDFK